MACIFVACREKFIIHDLEKKKKNIQKIVNVLHDDVTC
jgi:hypothetical protein